MDAIAAADRTEEQVKAAFRDLAASAKPSARLLNEAERQEAVAGRPSPTKR
jgi:hypothetical protein